MKMQIIFLNFFNNLLNLTKLNIFSHYFINRPKNNKELFFRDYRYKYFNNLIDKREYDFIFTAHHYNDQIETLYMRNFSQDMIGLI